MQDPRKFSPRNLTFHWFTNVYALESSPLYGIHQSPHRHGLIFYPLTMSDLLWANLTLTFPYKSSTDFSIYSPCKIGCGFIINELVCMCCYMCLPTSHIPTTSVLCSHWCHELPHGGGCCVRWQTYTSLWNLTRYQFVLFPSAPAFTVENIMAAMKGVESKWDDIGHRLCVPWETRLAIRTQGFADSAQCLREVLLYVLSLHPYPGWRVTINALYWMGEYPRIEEYAQPVAGMETISYDNYVPWHWLDIMIESGAYYRPLYHVG